MSQYKQGIVKAVKQRKDKRWAMRFDRKDPKDKPKSWYVYLLLGITPPNVGDMWGSYTDKLKRVKDLSGCDCYEQLAEQTKPTTRTIDREGDDMQTLEQIKASEIEKEQLKCIDSLGWGVIESIVVAMGRHEHVKGLTVGEIAMMMTQHPEEMRNAIAKGIKTVADEILTTIKM